MEFTVQGNGLTYGVRLILNASTSDRYCSLDWNRGFLVQVHKPHEQAQPRAYGYWAQASHETRIFINPYTLATTTEIKDIPMDIRRCIFQDESPLKFYGYVKEYFRKLTRFFFRFFSSKVVNFPEMFSTIAVPLFSLIFSVDQRLHASQLLG